uniref:Family with sequence similarity 170 member A n=1 Tax=Pipistrellus kuhlii TaxID=59472 RepID=A0A7J7T0C4_PIPKU|nr:hypothetical protein mPipKuh1_009744 [Pipistrellus kuhlii]
MRRGVMCKHRISQYNVPQSESSVEASACSYPTGEEYSFSEHPLGVSTTSKRPRLDEDAKLDSREEALQHRHKAGAITQSESESTASSSDSVIFLSSKDKRIGAENRIRPYKVPQSESSVEASASSYPTGEEYSFSEHPFGVATTSKRPRLDEDAKLDSREEALPHRHKAGAITQSESESTASSSDSVIFLSSKDKRIGAEHRISQYNVPQSESSVEASACSYPTGEEYSFSEHPLGVSTTSKRPRLDEDVKEYTAKLDSREEALQHRHKAGAITQSESESTASSSDSVIFLSSKDKRIGAEHRISQDNLPQSESSVEASACSYPTGEESSFSDHLIGDSTTMKRPLLDEDGKEYTEIKEMPVSRILEQTEDTSDYSHTEIPSHAFNNNEPVMSPEPGTEQRLKKIYYMRVQLKRGVAVLYHTKEGWVPPSKKVKMEEMFYIGKVHKNVPDSHMSEDEHLISPEPMLDSRAQEKREEADSPAQPPAQSWYPSANMPEWLVAQDTGFRCMACCRVFSSLEVLQEHVECGVREGFSCHVYHKAMTILKYEERQRKEKEKRIRQRFDARRKII